jgi:hypothetical protein
MLLSSLVIAAAPEQWYLMTRHGECSSLSVLERKIPNFHGFKSLESFLQDMKTRGYRVTHEPIALPNGQAFQVQVPELSLSVVFVTSELCTTFIEHK